MFVKKNTRIVKNSSQNLIFNIKSLFLTINSSTLVNFIPFLILEQKSNLNTLEHFKMNRHSWKFIELLEEKERCKRETFEF